ncbi:transport-associated protein [Pseudomonas cannabina pv. alisalensis]|uniref:Transport-associated protein n=2 Tax=Pseudomonas cannabina TaxID=86840 RepID=A0AB37QHP8_PSECA|nr:transport-associated protein [Pseudomonas cannabina pv. alisalensis]RMN84636.1 transport-associated protein [Pseudomonas cannabina]RMN87156.1 transport-associated protein [Pseudomonas cannabina pv. alisalensis]
MTCWRVFNGVAAARHELPRRQSSRGLSMNDLTLRRTILDELEFLPHIDAAAIGVTIENGVVVLSGHVKTFAEKIAAERAVKSVKGVRAVAEELDVRVPSELYIDDSVIASRCLDLIHWNSASPEQAIQIKVQQGWVTLEGDVEWQYQKEAAQKAINTLAGIAGLDNLLIVKPESVALDIKTLIDQALARSSELDASKIRVTAEGNQVTLEGYVHRWRERKAVEHAAWAVPGVKNVDNHLLIN